MWAFSWLLLEVGCCGGTWAWCRYRWAVVTTSLSRVPRAEGSIRIQLAFASPLKCPRDQSPFPILLLQVQPVLLLVSWLDAKVQMLFPAGLCSTCLKSPSLPSNTIPLKRTFSVCPYLLHTPTWGAQTVLLWKHLILTVVPTLRGGLRFCVRFPHQGCAFHQQRPS